MQKRRQIVRKKLEELLELDYGDVVVKNGQKSFDQGARAMQVKRTYGMK